MYSETITSLEPLGRLYNDGKVAPRKLYHTIHDSVSIPHKPLPDRGQLLQMIHQLEQDINKEKKKHNEKLSEIETEKKQKESEIVKMATESNQLQARIKQLEQEINDAKTEGTLTKTELDSKKTEFSALAEEKKTLDDEIATLRNEKNIQDDKMVVLDQEMNTLKKDLKEKTEQLRSVMSDLSQAELKVKQMQVQLNDAGMSQDDVKRLTEEKMRYLEQIQELKEAQQELIDNNQQIIKTLKEKADRAELELRQEHARQIRDKETQLSEATLLSNRYQTLKNDFIEFGYDVHPGGDQEDDFNRFVVSQHRNLQNQNKTQQLEIDQLRQTNSTQLARIQTLRNEAETYSTLLDQLKNGLQQSEDWSVNTIHDFVTQYATERKELEEKTRLLGVKTDEIAKMEQTKRDLQQQLRDITRQKEEVDLQNELLRSQVDTRKGMKDAAFEKLNETIEKLTQQEQLYKLHLRETNETLQQAESEIKTLQEGLKEHEETVRELQQSRQLAQSYDGKLNRLAAVAWDNQEAKWTNENIDNFRQIYTRLRDRSAMLTKVNRLFRDGLKDEWDDDTLKEVETKYRELNRRDKLLSNIMGFLKVQPGSVGEKSRYDEIMKRMRHVVFGSRAAVSLLPELGIEEKSETPFTKKGLDEQMMSSLRKIKAERDVATERLDEAKSKLQVDRHEEIIDNITTLQQQLEAETSTRARVETNFIQIKEEAQSLQNNYNKLQENFNIEKSAKELLESELGTVKKSKENITKQLITTLFDKNDGSKQITDAFDRIRQYKNIISFAKNSLRDENQNKNLDDLLKTLVGYKNLVDFARKDLLYDGEPRGKVLSLDEIRKRIDAITQNNADLRAQNQALQKERNEFQGYLEAASQLTGKPYHEIASAISMLQLEKQQMEQKNIEERTAFNERLESIARNLQASDVNNIDERIAQMNQELEKKVLQDKFLNKLGNMDVDITAVISDENEQNKFLEAYQTERGSKIQLDDLESKHAELQKLRMATETEKMTLETQLNKIKTDWNLSDINELDARLKEYQVAMDDRKFVLDELLTDIDKLILNDTSPDIVTQAEQHQLRVRLEQLKNENKIIQNEIQALANGMDMPQPNNIAERQYILADIGLRNILMDAMKAKYKAKISDDVAEEQINTQYIAALNARLRQIEQIKKNPLQPVSQSTRHYLPSKMKRDPAPFLDGKKQHKRH
eukprot:TRINITY_DN2682_c0_g1_i1.p1 TRINITY_DN2682_c0_g1~~TRINITY_DN2682_c0_g1_i1.p1  ORF type:complete len:1196 (+),score=61.89 TRINITY_DN2682_c0_g1_i1:2910-6497(+)